MLKLLYSVYIQGAHIVNSIFFPVKLLDLYLHYLPATGLILTARRLSASMDSRRFLVCLYTRDDKPRLCVTIFVEGVWAGHALFHSHCLLVANYNQQMLFKTNKLKMGVGLTIIIPWLWNVACCPFHGPCLYYWGKLKLNKLIKKLFSNKKRGRVNFSTGFMGVACYLTLSVSPCCELKLSNAI